MMNLDQADTNPFERRIFPDLEMPSEKIDTKNISQPKEAFIKNLPAPKIFEKKVIVQWNSIALFFNLSESRRPEGYINTTNQDVVNWLDEGLDQCNPKISEFMANYWSTLSYGRLAFGVNTPRDSSGVPLVPLLNSNSGDWGGLINEFIDLHAEAIWQASGGLMHETKRWIPSIVLVQHYPAHASAAFGGYERTVGGVTYLIGDYTHIEYDLSMASLPGVPHGTARNFWGTLSHEYSHNFLEFPDLYGPQGCTGYWDLLGDNTPPGCMSEVCSHLKERVRWLSFKEVIRGPSFPSQNFSLKPYTTSGEAIKVIPDPDHNPHEFFLLEYRKSTGSEVWKPDGRLPEEGLLIIHINDRMGVSGVWLMRDAPYFDPEFADFSDRGGTLWTGYDRLTGILFPQSRNNEFTPTSQPSSNFYGNRPSGLEIKNIRNEGTTLNFQLSVNCNSRIGWTVGNTDRCIAGGFTPESRTEGEEIFCRNDTSAALLIHRQAQWLVAIKQDDWIGGWRLGQDNYELAADLDGDGQDEIYIRSPEWAGVLKWERRGFNSVTVQHDWIDDWKLGTDNHEIAADVDGDNKKEILIRSSEWAGIIKLVDSQLHLQSIQHDRIDDWNLGPSDKEYVGKFSQNGYEEILIRSPEWLGLIQWDEHKHGLKLKSIQHDRIDDWNLGPSDKEYVGDFDGDGQDEIYIRSPEWAGVLKYQGDRFHLLWIRRSNIQHMDENPSNSISLTGDDLSYSGRLLPDRNGILHRNNNMVAILNWNNSQMMIRHLMTTPFANAWNLSRGDKFVLGDFHRLGPDITGMTPDPVADNLTDVFIHNSWGTGMFGVNYVGALNPTTGRYWYEEIGLTWINESEILYER
jgi:hypothetical protein